MAVKLAPCGTDSAYRRHIRRGEKACDPCLEAHRAETARHRQSQGTHTATQVRKSNVPVASSTPPTPAAGVAGSAAAIRERLEDLDWQRDRLRGVIKWAAEEEPKAVVSASSELRQVNAERALLKSQLEDQQAVPGQRGSVSFQDELANARARRRQAAAQS